MAINTLVVTTALDQNDGSSDNGLSLRDALIIANNDVFNEYVIELAGGTRYVLSLPRDNSSEIAGGDLDIGAGANVTIRSNNNQPAIVDASGLSGVFEVFNGGRLTLEGLTVTGGFIQFGTNGGGITVNSNAVLNLFNSTVTENSSNRGGGINNFGNTNIYNSTISSNTAELGGGHITAV